MDSNTGPPQLSISIYSPWLKQWEQQFLACPISIEFLLPPFELLPKLQQIQQTILMQPQEQIVSVQDIMDKVQNGQNISTMVTLNVSPIMSGMMDLLETNFGQLETNFGQLTRNFPKVLKKIVIDIKGDQLRQIQHFHIEKFFQNTKQGNIVEFKNLFQVPEARTILSQLLLDEALIKRQLQLSKIERKMMIPYMKRVRMLKKELLKDIN